MTPFFEDPASWGLIVGTPVAATVIYRGRQTITGLRRSLASSQARADDLQMRLEDAVGEAKERAEDGTKSVLLAAMRTLQGLAGEQQLLIAEMQAKYGHLPALQSFLEIDHANAQFARRAQSIAVLCGGWTGRRRSAASVYDVVRSAKGRIRHFSRVEIRSQSNLAIVSRAVEPVALALAELLDNAASYSAPETTIEINIRPVPNGLCLIVDDAGVGMSDQEKAKAGELLSGARSPGVSGLGNPPQFGFAVIGELAQNYGFRVSVDSTSPYGGVRAVVLLPDALLTTAVDPEEPVTVVEPNPPVRQQQETRPVHQDASITEAPDSEPGGLPRRRRFRGPMTVVPEPEPTADDTARDSAAVAFRIGAFQQGTRAGRATPSSEGYEA